MIQLYKKIEKKLSEINFQNLWPNFHKFKFALYNKENVVLNNNLLDWDKRFLGNTAINYNDEVIAIWDITNNKLNNNILASKIIHEMFHAFQMELNEKRWPNEIESIIKYNYNNLNLSLKYQENLLLIEIFNNFSPEKLNLLLSYRKLRKQRFPIEYEYETKIETIEGMAQYIELISLKQISPKDYNNEILKLLTRIKDKSKLFPIRNISYDIGALICLILDYNKIDFNHLIGSELKTISDLVLENNYEIVNYDRDLKLDTDICKLREMFINETKDIIDNFLEKSCHWKEIKGYKVGGFDPYNARYFNKHLYCPMFYVIKSSENEISFETSSAVLVINEDLDILKIYL